MARATTATEGVAMDLVDGQPIPVAGLLRAARAIADLSQRGLAERSGIPKSVVSRMETDGSGASTALTAFVQALNACGLTVTIHRDGRQLLPDTDPERDQARRQFPPHLDPHTPEPRLDLGLMTRVRWERPNPFEPPVRVYRRSPEIRDSRRRGLDYPWHARFWADTAHLAPDFTVSELVARKRALRAQAEERNRWWRAEEKRIRDSLAERERRDHITRSGEEESGPRD